MSTIDNDLTPDGSDEYAELLIMPRRELTYDILLESINKNKSCKLFIKKAPTLTTEQRNYLMEL